MHVGSHARVFIVKSLPATQEAFQVHHSSSWVLCTSHPEVLHTRPHKRLCSFDLPATQPTHSPTKEGVVRQLWVCFITVGWAQVSSSLPSLSQHTSHAWCFSGRFSWQCLLHSIDKQISSGKSLHTVNSVAFRRNCCGYCRIGSQSQTPILRVTGSVRLTVKFHTTLQAHTMVGRIMKVQATPKLVWVLEQGYNSHFQKKMNWKTSFSEVVLRLSDSTLVTSSHWLYNASYLCFSMHALSAL